MKNEPITPNQNTYLVNLIDKHKKEALQRCKVKIGLPKYYPIDRLTKRQASELITAMIAETEK